MAISQWLEDMTRMKCNVWCVGHSLCDSGAIYVLDIKIGLQLCGEIHQLSLSGILHCFDFYLHSHRSSLLFTRRLWLCAYRLGTSLPRSYAPSLRYRSTLRSPPLEDAGALQDVNTYASAGFATFNVNVDAAQNL